MVGFLFNNRLKINKDLKNAVRRRYFTPILFGSYESTTNALKSNLSGICLDIGCGDMPYKETIEKYVERYDTSDIEERIEGVTYVCSSTDMGIIPDNEYDSVTCLQVLEHVPDPFKSISEMNRILKPGGILLITVPHLSRIHEAPYDFFRYTKFGLREILEKSGFEVQSIEEQNGLFSFLGHQISTVFLALFWGIPLLKWLCFLLNILFVVYPCVLLDRIPFIRMLYPQGYICIAKKV